MKKIIKLRTVIQVAELSRSTIYALIAKKKFPKQIKLADNSVAWLESEIAEWLDDKIKQRDEA